MNFKNNDEENIDYNMKFFEPNNENIYSESISEEFFNFKKKEPKIIVFEGIDGSGKTTQIKILKKYLDFKGYSYYQTREPGGSPLGEKIRDVFLKEKNLSIESQILLCTASRIEHIKYINELKKSNNFDYIIFDRFIDSTMAYQIIANKLNPEILNSLNKKFKIDLNIDIAILLDINPMHSLNRRKKFENHFDSDLQYLKNVRNAYLKIWRKHKDSQNNYKKRILIESEKNPKIVFKKILIELKKYNII
jgi:dTMP kinase